MTAPPSLPDAQEAAHRLPPLYLRHRSAQRESAQPGIRREALLVIATLAVAAILRLTLASRGWSYVNSDEGVWGLMVDDIRWHGAHPLFLYGAHYMGALQTYLAVPFFALLGPTSFALHATTTTEILLFLLVLYLFTRQVYSPGVAWLTLALLALGPGQAIFYEMRAAAHAQDALLFSTLVLWLSFLRLRRPERAQTRLLLDLGIGLAAGIGLWCTFLTLPFLVSAGLALGVEALRATRSTRDKQRGRQLTGQFLILAAGLIIGAMPFIIGNISSGGAGIKEMVSASGAPGGDNAAPSGIPGHLLALGQQAAATLLIGLPRLLGSQSICANCPLWPAPQTSAAPAEILHTVLISILFSLVAVALWLRAALPLAYDVRTLNYVRQGLHARVQKTASGMASSWGDARWWGRAMLISGAALTVIEYAMSRSSYETPDTSMRYLVGLYLCTPLVANPLWRGSRQVWRWRTTYKHHLSLAKTGSRLPSFLAVGLLISIFALNIAGAVSALRESTSRQTYGIPAGQRDEQLLAFLQAHHITRFYTSYWVCYRLMFDAEEQITCAVLSNENAFASGYNRVPGYITLLAATPHPAYLFDLTTHEVQPQVPAQIAQHIAAGDSRFDGYTKAMVANYLVYYYVGAS